MAKLALFEKSGIGAFGTAMLKAAMHDMEDPTKKFLAAVTFDECRHDEVCRRACNKLCPSFPYKYHATTDFEKRALKNIIALYDNGRRYWDGFMKAWDKYPLELIFSSFFFAEIGAQLIFKTVSELSNIRLYKEAFQNVTVDESRHIAGTLSLLDNLARGFPSDQKLAITRQMKHGFIFLSPCCTTQCRYSGICLKTSMRSTRKWRVLPETQAWECLLSRKSRTAGGGRF